ncbi:CG10570 [Drosophila busckii]|uniref:CG10570 n=1 Tax=Drosophila busckii TaxID=30019 RepID=A0A0M3QU94_DROBS|nr:uncharacterized protein LOC108599690 [Drosophila busckii]ALC39360.1 CG10570 [Drosophila busckii]ALC40239.1 CG10570 [Drosophila busckii]
MVYAERTDKCLAKNDASQSKSPKTSSASYTKQQSNHGSGSWSSQASSADKWKYNNMVKDNRDQFNGMHFG